jgi:hypothetical protein
MGGTEPVPSSFMMKAKPPWKNLCPSILAGAGVKAGDVGK